MKKNKKTFVFILLVVVVLLFLILTVKGRIDDRANLPSISVYKGTPVVEAGQCSFLWKVKNLSPDSITFVDGNIEKWEITNTHTNKTYTNALSDKKIVLKTNEEYENTIILQELEEGHYSGSVWAKSEEGTTGKITFSFDVNQEGTK